MTYRNVTSDQQKFLKLGVGEILQGAVTWGWYCIYFYMYNMCFSWMEHDGTCLEGSVDWDLLHGASRAPRPGCLEGNQGAGECFGDAVNHLP